MMKIKSSFSTPSKINKNSKLFARINKLIIHDLNSSEPKKKVMSIIKKMVKSESSLNNKNFIFNYGKEFHKMRSQLNAFNKKNLIRKDLLSFFHNENKKFKKILQKNQKESFNSKNNQKKILSALSLSLNNNNKYNIFVESPLLMTSDKDINSYYLHYDENIGNVYKDKKTNVHMIDEENDESINFSKKLLKMLNRLNYKKNNIISFNVNSLTPIKDNNSNNNNKNDYLSVFYQKKNSQNLWKENMEIKKYNNSIKQLLDTMQRNKRHSTYSHKNLLGQITNLRNSHITASSFKLGQKDNNKYREDGNKYSLDSYNSPRRQSNSSFFFEKVFKDMLRNKNNFYHIESIYKDIQKSKNKFLKYKVDKRVKLYNYEFIDLKSNNHLYENEKNKTKEIKSLDFELFSRFYNYKNFK